MPGPDTIIREIIRDATGKISAVIETSKTHGTIIRKTVVRDPRTAKISSVIEEREAMRAPARRVEYTTSRTHMPVPADLLRELEES